MIVEHWWLAGALEPGHEVAALCECGVVYVTRHAKVWVNVCYRCGEALFTPRQWAIAAITVVVVAVVVAILLVFTAGLLIYVIFQELLP